MKAIKNSVKEYASETSSAKWDSINWNTMERKVATLQVRIVKAYKAKQYRKVRSLQWVLARSYAGKLLAVKRVTSNKGSRTSGVDGVLWSTDNSKMNAVQSLKRKGYKPMPLRRIYIPKANGKQRPLSIPTMKDRAMQALYLLVLNPIAETKGDVNSYGFRPKRSCADALTQCFAALANKGAAQWILDADIKGCFDNISHEWLYNNIPIDKRILRLWLNAKIIDGKSFFHAQSGTPQGGIISPVLANMVLDGLETVLNTLALKTFSKKTGYVERNDYRVNYIRYAD
ncbi:MAG TPA: reverse transcriptase N-terminal domain-containing protein, partial [Chlamydiales bacterium]|nr:reverse transcriptase N-terminal domain-containing protein [Chlamydiales bacterium]